MTLEGNVITVCTFSVKRGEEEGEEGGEREEREEKRARASGHVCEREGGGGLK